MPAKAGKATSLSRTTRTTLSGCALTSLKQLRNPERIARFQKEVSAGLRLDHPNVLKVEAYDLDRERPYLITRYLQRKHLSEEERQQLTPVAKMRLFAQICRGVGHAHPQAIVHRDIKPDNVLIDDDGQPKVADFGLCYLRDDDVRATQEWEAVGPRFYMAPELAHGRLEADAIRPACDIYSLGKLLYWLFAGAMFDRELHHDPRFDLRLKEPRLVHRLVYEVLDRTIIEDPQKRSFFLDANSLAEFAETQAERIAMDAHVINIEAPQPCHYCRLGEYQVRVDPSWWTGVFKAGKGVGDAMEAARSACREYGLVANAGRPWLVLQCDHCGNVQMFQLFGTPNALTNWNV